MDQGAPAALTRQDPDAQFPQRQISFGTALFNERVRLAREADSSFTLLESATVISILIGLATTVFAGLRSDDQAVGQWKRTVSVLAVLFPALGTAVAAVAAFYGPREQLLRDSQALATLQQTHNEMSVGITREPCPLNSEQSRSIMERLTTWQDKLVQQRPETAVARLAAIANPSGRTTGGAGFDGRPEEKSAAPASKPP